MVRRSRDSVTVSDRLAATRFVSIVGARGVGKTTLAVAVGHDLIDVFTGAVLFVNLGALNDPALTAATIASMLGLSAPSADATPALVAHLRGKQIPLIPDTCEHVIEAVADLAMRIFVAAPLVHILARSREALRVGGERVYRLAPLACRPDDPGLAAADALTFPATQLFVERAAASGAGFEIQDADAPIVAGICRKLDGVALAIELAAGRVAAHGLQQTAALLDQRLTLLWPGQRTAPPRQKTLRATLDWSCRLLSEVERVVFRRLAVFVGGFTIEAAPAVATSADVDQAVVFGAIDNLVAKSMVASRPSGAMTLYRLSDAARYYDIGTIVDAIELAALAARHAEHYRRWLAHAGAEWPNLSSATERPSHVAALGNARVAPQWCFGDTGAVALGIALAVAAAPALLAMSLLTECQRWSERAILALDESARSGLEEMHLQAPLGVSLMFTRGGSDAARRALTKSLAIAEQRGDAIDQLKVLAPLRMFHIRTGRFTAALHCARRCSVVAGTLEDAAAIALAHALLGISLHLGGELSGARAEFEAALRHGPRTTRTTTIYLGFESRILAGVILARTLWLQGHPVEAMDRARETVQQAAFMDHSLTLSIALIWAASMFQWSGDLAGAEEHIDWLFSRAESRSLAPYLAVGRGFSGELAIRRGDAGRGIECLRDSLNVLRAAPYEPLTTPLRISLAQGLAAAGQATDGLALVDETIRQIEASGDFF